jgi:hypothetical protein
VADGSCRFPPPWRADKISGGYVVRDANEQAIAYVYSRPTLVEAMQAKVLTADEARRIAINIADHGGQALPETSSRPHAYVVRDANGQAIAYIYGRPTLEAMQAKALTADEARRFGRQFRM